MIATLAFLAAAGWRPERPQTARQNGTAAAWADLLGVAGCVLVVIGAWVVAG